MTVSAAPAPGIDQASAPRPELGTDVIDANGSLERGLASAREAESDLAGATPQDPGKEWHVGFLRAYPPERIARPVVQGAGAILGLVVGTVAGLGLAAPLAALARGNPVVAATTTAAGAMGGVVGGVLLARRWNDRMESRNEAHVQREARQLEAERAAVSESVQDLQAMRRAAADPAGVSPTEPAWQDGVSGTVGGAVGQMVPVAESRTTSRTSSNGSGSDESTRRGRFVLGPVSITSPFERSTSTESMFGSAATTRSTTWNFASQSEPFAIGRRLTGAGAHATAMSAAMDPVASQARGSGAVIVAEEGGFTLYEIDTQQSGRPASFQQQDQIVISDPRIQGLVVDGGIFGPTAQVRDTLTNTDATVYTFQGSTQAEDRASALPDRGLTASWHQATIDESGAVSRRSARSVDIAASGVSMLELTSEAEALAAAARIEGDQAVIDAGTAFRLASLELPADHVLGAIRITGDEGERGTAVEVDGTLYSLSS